MKTIHDYDCNSGLFISNTSEKDQKKEKKKKPQPNKLKKKKKTRFFLTTNID